MPYAAQRVENQILAFGLEMNSSHAGEAEHIIRVRPTNNPFRIDIKRIVDDLGIFQLECEIGFELVLVLRGNEKHPRSVLVPAAVGRHAVAVDEKEMTRGLHIDRVGNSPLMQFISDRDPVRMVAERNQDRLGTSLVDPASTLAFAGTEKAFDALPLTLPKRPGSLPIPDLSAGSHQLLQLPRRLRPPLVVHADFMSRRLHAARGPPPQLFTATPRDA